MLSKKIAALALVLTFLALPLAFTDNADAAEAGDLTSDNLRSRAGSFVEGSSGSVTVFVINDTDNSILAKVFATFIGSDGRLAEWQGIVPGVDVDDNPGEREVTLSFRISSPGTHWVQVWVSYDVFIDPDNPVLGTEETTEFLDSFEIQVGTSIWSNTSTYIIIIVVIIILAIVVYVLKIRNPAGKREVAAGTFTAMESRKRAKKQAEPEEYYEEEEEYEGTELFEEEEEAVPAVPAETEKKTAPAEKKAPAAEKKEYTGKVSSTKKKQSSPQRKSNPSSRKSSKRR